MKKYIFWLIILIIVLIVILGIYRQANHLESDIFSQLTGVSSFGPPEETKIAVWPVYTDKNWGFSISHPADIKPETDFKAYDLADYQNV